MDDGGGEGQSGSVQPGTPPSGVAESGFVLLPDNPPPEGAEVVWVNTRGGKRVRLLVAGAGGGRKPRGTALVCPGRTEFIEKYFEVGRDLQARGFAVVIFDWPGQGLSSRLHRNPLLGHVSGYDVYVDAMARCIEKLGRRAPKPHVVVAHSMGATIALEALRGKRITVAAAAFSAPMWGLNIPFHLRWAARLAHLFVGGRPARPQGPPETFETNLLTHDETRWRLYRRLIEAEPRLDVGQPSFAWVVSSLDVLTKLFREPLYDHLRDTPILVAIAEKEGIVKSSEARRLARRLRAAKTITVKGARHEILMETDERRAVFWSGFDETCKRAKV